MVTGLSTATGIPYVPGVLLAVYSQRLERDPMDNFNPYVLYQRSGAAPYSPLKTFTAQDLA